MTTLYESSTNPQSRSCKWLICAALCFLAPNSLPSRRCFAVNVIDTREKGPQRKQTGNNRWVVFNSREGGGFFYPCVFCGCRFPIGCQGYDSTSDFYPNIVVIPFFSLFPYTEVSRLSFRLKSIQSFLFVLRFPRRSLRGSPVNKVQHLRHFREPKEKAAREASEPAKQRPDEQAEPASHPASNGCNTTMLQDEEGKSARFLFIQSRCTFVYICKESKYAQTG